MQFLNRMFVIWLYSKTILLGISCLLSYPDLIAGYGHVNCERVPLKGPRGSIKSPGYPYAYHNHTSCSWIIKKKPEEVVTINFIDLDIEEDSSCTLNYVKLGDDIEQKQFCGQNGTLPEPLTFEGTEVWVKFHASLEAKGGRGFQLTYFVGACSGSQIKCNNGVECYPIHEKCNGQKFCKDFSDELNCGRCPVNHTSCSLTSNYCFNPYIQHCNRVLDCPNGIDELGCDSACENKIICNSGIGCYSLHERCDGVPQCQDDSDEKYCNSELCRSERGGFLCANERCIREIWSCDRTNDCGDGSDERNNCLKNSVITAAVMGSLICGLLLVVAISCSCKLYALRNVGTSSSTRETPLSRLEREFLYREPPPSYAVAIGDPRAYYPDILSNPGQLPRRNSHRHGRRSRSHRQRSVLGVNRPPPIVEELSETFNTSVVTVNRGAVLELDRQNSNSSGNSGSTLSTPESSPVVKDVTSTLPPLSSNEQSTSQNIEESLSKTDSESSLSDPQSTCDRVPLLPN